MRSIATTRGFSLVEILIAITILMIGLCGIFAVFPAATQALSEVERDTYAPIIAESVKASIEVGMESLKGIDEGGNEFFCYMGEGVPDNQRTPWKNYNSRNYRNIGYLQKLDSYVKIPKQVDVEYCVPKPTSTHRRADGSIKYLVIDKKVTGTPVIDRVFHLGEKYERILEDAKEGHVDKNAVEVTEAARDSYRHYSYAFTIKRVLMPRDRSELLYVQVFVYKNFPETVNGKKITSLREDELTHFMKGRLKRNFTPVFVYSFYLAP